MQRLDIEPHETPSPRLITRAAEIIHGGAVAGYPTDSVYALGCAIEAKRAAERIYRAKQMKKTQRLAMLCPDLSSAAMYAHFSREAFRLARSILPGPYTLVLPATREVPRLLLDHRRRKVGIRIPDHPVTQALLKELGRPMLTTSAVVPMDEEDDDDYDDDENPGVCTDADELIEGFGKHLDLVIDSGTTNTAPTTVLEVDGDQIIVIREGSGPIDFL